MKRFTKILFVVGSAALLFASSAQAQVSSSSAAGAAPPTAAVDITLQGTIQSALVLTITPGAGTVFLSTASNGMPLRSAATFDFGTFNTMSPTLTNGSIHRVAAATPGAFVVAPLVARVTISGSAGNATVNLSTVAGAGTSPIGAGNVRFQLGAGTWAASTDGTVLGAAAPVLCGAACATSVDYAHTLGLFVPDTQAAGNFTQVVSYDATL